MCFSYKSIAHEIVAQLAKDQKQDIVCPECNNPVCNSMGQVLLGFGRLARMMDCPDRKGTGLKQDPDREKIEKAPVKELTQEQILGLIPAQAIINYDRAKVALQKALESQRDADHEYYLALIPDIEEAKRRERERIIDEIEGYCGREIEHHQTALKEWLDANGIYAQIERAGIDTLSRVKIRLQALQDKEEE